MQEHQTGKRKACEGHYGLQVHPNQTVNKHKQVEHLYV